MGVAKCGSYDQSQNTTPTEWKIYSRLTTKRFFGRWIQVWYSGFVTDEELQFESLCEFFDLASVAVEITNIAFPDYFRVDTFCVESTDEIGN